MSKLHALNFFIVQWFFIRICRVINDSTGKQEYWGILYPATPLTGWWTGYIFNTPKCFKILKYKGK